MTAARKIAFADQQPVSASAGTEQNTAPSIIVDIEAAEVVGANSDGAEAIGIFSYANFPFAIDPATPALARLREISADLAEPRSERLIFRIGGLLRPMNFKVSKVDTESRSPRIRLEVVDARPSSENPASSENDEKAAENTSEDKGPLVVAETLKQIALEICRATFSGANATTVSQFGQAEPQSATPLAPAAAIAAEYPQPYPLRQLLPMLDPDHLARLAHELKTPLTAIAAAAEIMRDERLGAMGNERYLSYASDIHESAHHALDVITSLLLESGRPSEIAARLIALDLNAIVARTVSSMQALAQTHGLVLAFDPAESQPHVVANPTAIRQILLNLLTNAIKFTPPGGDVRVVTGYSNDGRVILAVRDTGRGMTGTKDMEADGKLLAGFGMGLPLVRRLISEMGGELQIDSVPQKGTAVLVSFGSYASWPART